MSGPATHREAEAQGTGAPAIGLWGTWDADRFGDALCARILAAELTRRLPTAYVRVQAPFGFLHATRFDAAAELEPLGAFATRRVDELAGELDCVVVSGIAPIPEDDAGLARLYAADPAELGYLDATAFLVDGLGAEPEARTPVIWLGVTVPEGRPATEGRVHAARAERPLRELAGLPSPLLLTPRAVGPALVRRRLDQLRATGAYPAEGRPLLVAVGPGLSARAGAVARAVRTALADDPGRGVVVMATDGAEGDGRAAAAMLAHLPPGARRLSDTAGTDDLVSAIAGAGALLGGAPGATGVARGLGVPVVDIAAIAETELPAAIRDALHAPADAGAAGLVEPRARLDAGLDRVAELAARSRATRGGAPVRAQATPEDPLALLARAHAERTRRLGAELTRAHERAGALAAARDDQERALVHVRGVYERTRAQAAALAAHLKASQALVHAREAALAAAERAAADVVASVQHHAAATVASVSEGSEAALRATADNAAQIQSALEGQVAHFVAALESLRAHADTLTAQRDGATAQAATLRRGVDVLEGELAQARGALATVLSSPAWRALAPARRVGTTVRRLRR